MGDWELVTITVLTTEFHYSHICRILNLYVPNNLFRQIALFGLHWIDGFLQPFNRPYLFAGCFKYRSKNVVNGRFERQLLRNVSLSAVGFL